MTFYCNDCDVTRAITSRVKHNKSQIHLRNIGQVVETKPLGRPPAPLYTCDVCNVTLKTAGKHLQSKTHQDNVKRSNEPKIETKIEQQHQQSFLMIIIF